MNQLQAMRTFIKVADSMSFAIAAKQLGVSNAAVTRSIAMLEAHLNMRLINRSTRHLSLTDAGRAYLEGCGELIEQLDALEANVSAAGRESFGTLRIASASCFAQADLGVLLREYRREQPRVRFDLMVFDNQRDVAVGNYDVCFSAERKQRDSTLVCQPLTAITDTLVAAPEYLAYRGVPRAPQELAAHDMLLASDATTRYWEFADASGTQRIAVHAALASANVAAVRHAALAGLGIARLPLSLVEADITDGTLARVLPDHPLADATRTISILYGSRRYLAQSARSFIDFAVARLREPQSKRCQTSRAPARDTFSEIQI
jgi:DNA-binding transcriptional LysR family regulator